jgi:hypothetical protein
MLRKGIGLDGIQRGGGVLHLCIKVASNAQELNPVGHGCLSPLSIA